MARRLVEAGVPLVAVYTHGRDGFPMPHSVSWDTHQNNFIDLKEQILPIQDTGYAMLLEDLAQRGLDETLVVWFGEFGPDPQDQPLAGRDHWPDVYTVVFAGGGIRGGSPTDPATGSPPTLPPIPFHPRTLARRSTIASGSIPRPGSSTANRGRSRSPAAGADLAHHDLEIAVHGRNPLLMVCACDGEFPPSAGAVRSPSKGLPPAARLSPSDNCRTSSLCSPGVLVNATRNTARG